MHYKLTLEGYPVLLKTKTERRFFSEAHLPNRRSPWVYLTQNPRGRWQVLAPDLDEPGSVLCIAGASTAAQVLPVMVDYAFTHGILGRDKRCRYHEHTQKTSSALWSLGSFVTRAHQAAENAAQA